MRSSIITPTPPPRRWETLAGNGLTTSNTRKSRKPVASTGKVSGTPRTETIIPATSSTTIAPGSLRPSARSASSAAQVPTTVTNSASPARASGESCRSQRTAAVRALATVPGAPGARPTPPSVAMATARRVRAARLGALADELVAVDLDDPHAREVAGAEVGAAAQVDHAVDLRRLPGRAALPVEGAVLAGAVDEHVGLGADELGGALPGDGVLRFLHPRRALGGQLGIDLTGVRRRGRAVLRRVGED